MTLLPNEKIIYQTRPHPLPLILQFLVIVLIVLCLLLLHLLSPEIQATVSGKTWLAFITCFCVISALIVSLDWCHARLYLTNLRVLETHGIMTRQLSSIPLERIRHISIHFGPVGRIWNYGNLMIEADEIYGGLTFWSLSHPERVQRMIEKNANRLKSINPNEQKTQTFQKR